MENNEERPPTQGKNYLFTYNNYTLSPEELEALFKRWSYTFLVFQKERGQEGTPHYQGYVEFARQTRYSSINQALPDGEAIWFRRRTFGTGQAAADYCRKEDTREDGPWEYGELRVSQQGRRNDLQAFTDAVRSGKRTRELIDDFGAVLAKYPRYYATLQSLHMPLLRPDGVRVELSFGDTGVGKTRAVMDQYAGDPDFFRAPIGQGFWMDGYDGQRVVLLDDFAGAASKLPLTYLLQILDRYPVQVPIKGGFVWWYPELIIITTNIHPRLWYKWEDREEQYNALFRRFTTVKKNLREVHLLDLVAFKDWRPVPTPPPQNGRPFYN